jgi:hypothetical protein
VNAREIDSSFCFKNANEGLVNRAGCSSVTGF